MIQIVSPTIVIYRDYCFKSNLKIRHHCNVCSDGDFDLCNHCFKKEGHIHPMKVFKTYTHDKEESNSEGETSPTQEDIPRPCTSSMTNHVEDTVHPVRIVRVLAHAVSEREFVTVKRKRKKQKEYQMDCKTSLVFL